MKCTSLAVETFCMGNSSSCRVLGMFSAGQQLDIQNLVKGGNLDGMRWPDFSDYRNWLQKVYEPVRIRKRLPNWRDTRSETTLLQHRLPWLQLNE